MDFSNAAQLGMLSFAITDFAKKHYLSVETKFDGYWEGRFVSSMVLRWEMESGIHCLMKVMPSLYNYDLVYKTKWNFFIGAWIDKEDGRYGKRIMLRENEKYTELLAEITPLLNEGYTTLTSLKEEELELISTDHN
ncbi:MAG TPA: hypothetical protein VFO76_10535 [Candidatus Kapabacteria bacterium]|nr:hypothetical protein [Candidatus Kapabacteria bacterium]